MTDAGSTGSTLPGGSTILVVNKRGMGHAEPELSLKLIQSYLGLLDLEQRLPAAIFFYAEGVLLTLAESPVLAELQALQARGVRLGICGTCVNHFGVREQVRVGTIGSMRDLQTAQWAADKVITL